jgi:hypothetical protein
VKVRFSLTSLGDKEEKKRENSCIAGLGTDDNMDFDGLTDGFEGIWNEAISY